MKYLDPAATKLKNPTSGLPEKFQSQHSPDKVATWFSLEPCIYMYTLYTCSIAGNFEGSDFHGRGDLQRSRDLIFMDARSRIENMC